MLANVLNICSDEELEHDGAQVEDGMSRFDFENQCKIISLFIFS
jgi:hypothetical protein